MNIIKGQILGKEHEGGNIEKTILTMDLGGDEECFVEVRSKFLRDLISDLQVGDHIEIVILFDAKRSRSGNRFNNIVAKNIKTLH